MRVISLKAPHSIHPPGLEMEELQKTQLSNNYVIDFPLIGFFLNPATVKCLQDFSFQNSSNVIPSSEARNQKINNAETATEDFVYPVRRIFIYRKTGHSSLVW